MRVLLLVEIVKNMYTKRESKIGISSAKTSGIEDRKRLHIDLMLGRL